MNDLIDDLDFWERLELAADRAEDMAKAERRYTQLKKAGVSDEVINASRELGKLLGSDEDGDVPLYTDEDGPEVIEGAHGHYVPPRRGR